MNSEEVVIPSKRYWTNRYANGGTSGPGSYGRLAGFKAEIVNKFLRERHISSVAEFGVGDGNQLSLLNYPPDFIGYDICPAVLRELRQRFPQFGFELAWDRKRKFELTISMDVIYHLLEDETYKEYISDLFSASSRYVVIYSSNMEGGPQPAPHVRHRRFTSLVEEQHPEFRLTHQYRNRFPYTPGKDIASFSHSDFYVYELKRTAPPSMIVIMATWDRPERFEKTLQLLETQTDRNFEFFVWNNNSHISGLLNDRHDAANIHHANENVGGLGRFFLANSLAESRGGDHFVLFVDDDQDFGIDTIERARHQARPDMILSNWAFQIRSSYLDRKRVQNNRERVDYCGTGGMVAPLSFFDRNSPTLFNIPDEFRFIEDLWISVLASECFDMKLGYLDIAIREITDGKNQFGTMNASIQRKESFWRYLKRFRKDIP